MGYWESHFGQDSEEKKIWLYRRKVAKLLADFFAGSSSPVFQALKRDRGRKYITFANDIVKVRLEGERCVHACFYSVSTCRLAGSHGQFGSWQEVFENSESFLNWVQEELPKAIACIEERARKRERELLRIEKKKRKLVMAFLFGRNEIIADFKRKIGFDSIPENFTIKEQHQETFSQVDYFCNGKVVLSLKFAPDLKNMKPGFFITYYSPKKDPYYRYRLAEINDDFLQLCERIKKGYKHAYKR
ncbi:MAG: hypothetical protein HUK20_03155 [Fibrobacter sp.]|nr:hypothetical protein [Fibrobacter sp.]